MSSAATRPVTLDDLPAVSRLEREVFGTAPYPAFFFRQALALWPSLFVVAGKPPTLDGYALGAVSEGGDVGWILSVAVPERARGRGLGRTLTAALVEGLQRTGVKEVRLTVRPDTPAEAMYRSVGFQEVSRDADYFGWGEPRLVMAYRG